MNLFNRLTVIFLALVVFQSCEKNAVSTSNDDKASINPPELVKYVTWDVGVTHKLEFTYNTDNTIKSYTSGSSNLSWKHTSAFTYQNGKPTEMTHDGSPSTRYIYANAKVSQKSYIGTDGAETSRFSFTYNAKGQVDRLKVMVALNGILSLTQDVTYLYDTAGTLTETQNIWYDEHGAKLATVVRKYQTWSADLYVNPFALLHALYQHQATEVFDDVVLATVHKLPVKIVETGNPDTGAATYEYHITQTGKRIDKLNCVLKVGNVSYDTTEAIFHY